MADESTMGANTSPAMNPKEHKTLMGILAYLGPLVIIPLLAAKDDSFVKFHTKQGLVLLVLTIVFWILFPMFWTLWMLWDVVRLLLLLLAILGIINVVGGKEKALPAVGSLARYFNF